MENNQPLIQYTTVSDSVYLWIKNAIIQGDSVGARCAMIMHLTYNRQMLLRMKEDLAQSEKDNRSDE